jgi:hypothetical protein
VHIWICLDLFWRFLLVSLAAFGGSGSALPLVERMAVRRPSAHARTAEKTYTVTLHALRCSPRGGGPGRGRALPVSPAPARPADSA